jgi:hypothetical protein
MSLNLDWSKCEGDLGEQFGFYMMFTALGWEVTNSNAEDFYCRIKLHEKLVGPIYYLDGEPLDITPEMVKAHIGLRANVSPETWNQYVKRLTSHEQGESKRVWQGGR